ncbi:MULTISPECIES: PTS sugar transporter subunit IIB [Helcococcus]|uniref:PTS sugar transporter subunit IIB n=1 Tax=Helcococcus bovis TaxID=3153252 RepID=A0ABW9F483_9FIRM
MKIYTVCGNGIGSSLLLKMKVEEIAMENGIDVEVESVDSNAAVGKDADLFITVKEFENIFPSDKKVAIIRSYTNKKKITEDVLPILKEMSK